MSSQSTITKLTSVEFLAKKIKAKRYESKHSPTTLQHDAERLADLVIELFPTVSQLQDLQRTVAKVHSLTEPWTDETVWTPEQILIREG